MRAIRLSPEAEETLAAHIDFLIEQGAAKSAQVPKTRVELFLATLSTYPRTGRLIADRQIWETWIPHTRIVAWYVFTDDELVILTF